MGAGVIPDETPIRILYIGHIKYVQWGIFDGNISRNALKKPLKPKNWLRNLWKSTCEERFVRQDAQLFLYINAVEPPKM